MSAKPPATAKVPLHAIGGLQKALGTRGQDEMQRRKVDRAQRMRARRIWWDRNGAFVRGALTGSVLTALAAWLLQAVL